jgi:hypothetical protein
VAVAVAVTVTVVVAFARASAVAVVVVVVVRLASGLAQGKVRRGAAALASLALLGLRSSVFAGCWG